MKKVWFYKKGEQKEGAITRDQLQALLDCGEINETTLVWTQSLGDWVPIGELEHFHFNSLDTTPNIAMNKTVDYARETDDSGLKARPWIRFWARMTDYWLFVLLFGLFFSFFGLGPLVFLFAWGILFLWAFVEATLLTTLGTTPGKWLFKVRLRGANGKKLSFLDGINRSLCVWWLGMGAAFPVISLITMIVADVKLSNTGITSWDKRSDYRVDHQRIGVFRTLIVIGFFVVSVILAFPLLTKMRK